MNSILNTFTSDAITQNYYTVGSPVYENGEYRIFKQADKLYLYTYKDVAIAQLGGINKELIDALAGGFEPLSTNTFIYKRTIDNIRKGLNLKLDYNLDND